MVFVVKSEKERLILSIDTLTYCQTLFYYMKLNLLAQKTLFISLILGITLMAFRSDGRRFRFSQKYVNQRINIDSTVLFAPNDLEVVLWAESPMLYNPTNIDVDIKGRIWVTEAVNYRDFNNKADTRLNHPNGERVMILEDTDQDGKADKFTVFVEDKDLVSPLGIAFIGNKVVVSAAPNLIVYTDENGDDKADKKEILLTGFGGLDHDHSLHSTVAGPDGNWYFNVGNAGPHHVSDKNGWNLRSGSVYTGGTPHNTKNEGNQVSDDGRVWVGGMALRMNAQGKNLKVMAHNFRNSYEVALDSYGNMWQNDNDDQVIACRTSWVMENGNAGYFSADGTRAWQADRRPGQDMFTASWHQDDPGLMPAGDNTGAGSPTGMMVYEGDALGKAYRGMLLSCEAGRNVIFSYLPQAKGAGFELKRRDLISSQGPVTSEQYEWYATGQDKSKWFRPSDICVGTDGSLYIADWYDPIVGGHAMHDKKGYGRIYRLTPKNGKKLTPPKIDLSTIRGQIKALQSPAINVRNMGFEALRNEGSLAIPDVAELLNAPNPYHQARAIWLLSKMGKEGIENIQPMLQSTDPNLRLTTFRALRQTNIDLTAICLSLASDPDPALRREVGIALRDEPLEKCEEIITKLIDGYDGQDPWYLEALGTALDGTKAEEYYPKIKERFPESSEKWGVVMENLTFRLHPLAAIADLKNRCIYSSVSEQGHRKALTTLAFINNKAAAQAMLELSSVPLKDVSTQALWWLNFRRGNDWADMLDWEKQLATVMTPNQKKMAELKKKLQNQQLPLADRIASAKQMAKDPDGGNVLIDLKATYALDDAIAKEISEDIFNNPDAKVRIVASQFFTRNGQTLKLDFVTRMAGNVDKGKDIFGLYCANCHKIGEKGAEIGPDLSNIHKKFDKLGLLDAIINPSANIVFGYETWNITTKKGQTYIGFLVGEGKTISLKDMGGQLINIKAEDIKSKVKMEKSLMPDPTSLGLKEQDLANLVGYLQGLEN